MSVIGLMGHLLWSSRCLLQVWWATYCEQVVRCQFKVWWASNLLWTRNVYYTVHMLLITESSYTIYVHKNKMKKSDGKITTTACYFCLFFVWHFDWIYLVNIIYMIIKHSLDAKATKRISTYNIIEDNHIKAHKRTLISNVVLIKILII